MQDINSTSAKDIDFSQLPAAEINSLIQTLTAQNEKLSKRVNWFEEQFRLLKSKHYAKSSETQASLQLELFDEDETALQTAETTEEEKQTITYTRSPKRKPKNLDTSHLPREKRYTDLEESEKICDCGRCMEKFGEESREELQFKPAELKVIEHIRPKYACRDCDSVKMPPVVELPLSKSKASAGLITEVILNKYSYHLPFYRQSKIFANYGMAIPDNTLAGWAMKSAEALEMLSVALWEQLPLVRALQVDETPVKVLDPEKKGYMWVYLSYLPGQRFIIFDFNLSRGGAVVDERLKDYKGLLQTDGYIGYSTQRKSNDIITFGCWDHARRKYADVIKANNNNKSGKAGQMIKKTAELYEIEGRIKSASPDERKATRQAEAVPKLKAIRKFLYTINAPPKSLLGTAVTYMKNQWDELNRYTKYGEAEISNYLVENQIRPFALGKKNWLFVGNELSAQRAGLHYSLIQSCHLNGIDPRAYYEYVLSQVHRMRRKEVDPATLLPHTIDKELLAKPKPAPAPEEV